MKREVLLLGGVLIIFSFMAMGTQIFGSHRFNGYVLPQPIKAPEIVLRSTDGPVRFADFQGKYVLIYVGYTTCPDVCPTSLANLKLALGELSAQEAAEVQVIFVSVDPARDTPEALGRYVNMFRDDFIGATGTREEIDWVVDAFGAKYTIEPPDENGNYNVSHSAFTIVLDRNGYYVMNWEHGAPPNEISTDLRYLLKRDIPVSAQILAGPTYTPVVCAVTIVPAHVQGGQWLYEHHCAQCHGVDMAGNPQWQVELADGSHLAPPLNGSGSAWKYSETELVTLIKEGRDLEKPIHMPAFKSKLADWEIDYILSYIHTTWDINQLNYQHGFMTLTPQPTLPIASPPAPIITSTPSP
jgi:protein SCO1/2